MYVRPRTPRQQCSYALARYTVRSNQYIYRVATAALSPARTCHNIYSHTSKSQLRISSLLTNQGCNPLVPYPRPDTLWLASYWLLVRRPHNHSYALAHCQPLLYPIHGQTYCGWSATGCWPAGHTITAHLPNMQGRHSPYRILPLFAPVGSAAKYVLAAATKATNTL